MMVEQSPRQRMMEERYEEEQAFLLQGNRAIGDYLGYRYSSNKDGDGSLYRFPDGTTVPASQLKFHEDIRMQMNALDTMRQKGDRFGIGTNSDGDWVTKMNGDNHRAVDGVMEVSIFHSMASRCIEWADKQPKMAEAIG
jgi:hypothetical protein